MAGPFAFAVIMLFPIGVLAISLRIVGTSWSGLWRALMARQGSPERQPWTECLPRFKSDFWQINILIGLAVTALLFGMYRELF